MAQVFLGKENELRVGAQRRAQGDVVHLHLREGELRELRLELPAAVVALLLDGGSPPEALPYIFFSFCRGLHEFCQYLRAKFRKLAKMHFSGSRYFVPGELTRELPELADLPDGALREVREGLEARLTRGNRAWSRGIERLRTRMNDNE